ncbi:hypothetical protein Tco_0107093, partial [Tanacetum coccineum]
MGTTRGIIDEGTEGPINLGPERPRVYSELSQEEKDRSHSEKLHSTQASTELRIPQRQDVLDNAIDEDVDEQPVQDLALNVDNVFQVDDYPVYDEAGPSYDSDVLSEVQAHDHYQDAICDHHEEHEMHDDVQPNHVVDSHADYTSDSNMTPYDQYVKDNVVPVVQNKGSLKGKGVLNKPRHVTSR